MLRYSICRDQIIIIAHARTHTVSRCTPLPHIPYALTEHPITTHTACTHRAPPKLRQESAELAARSSSHSLTPLLLSSISARVCLFATLPMAARWCRPSSLLACLSIWYWCTTCILIVLTHTTCILMYDKISAFCLIFRMCIRQPACVYLLCIALYLLLYFRRDEKMFYCDLY